MGNVKGIRLLREETEKGADTETQVALIALNLGMFVSKLITFFSFFFRILKIYEF
jgi:hypothetical protein